DAAARLAGRIRHPGRFAMLLPRDPDMIAAGRHMPLPAPKPKTDGSDVKKADTKASTDLTTTGQALPRKATPTPKPNITATEVKKQSGKGDAVNVGELVADRNMAKPKPKTTVIEIKNQDGKRNADSPRSQNRRARPSKPRNKTAKATRRRAMPREEKQRQNREPSGCLLTKARPHCTDCGR